MVARLSPADDEVILLRDPVPICELRIQAKRTNLNGGDGAGERCCEWMMTSKAAGFRTLPCHECVFTCRDRRHFACTDDLEAFAGSVRQGKDQPYTVILMDPPFRGIANTPYPTSTNSTLERDLKPSWQWICSPDALVFIWYAGTKGLERARDLCQRLGLREHKHDFFVWLKTGSDGLPARSGPGPYTRPNIESVMLAVPSSRKNAPSLEYRGVAQGHLFPRPPRGQHSRKPSEFRKFIRQMCGPDQRYLEMYARYYKDRRKIAEYTAGWDSFGDGKW
jgi:N6-adenosine-specific RNA methylase IME4